MAIRKRHGATGHAYQVYWNNPYTGARESKTFHTLAEARKHDSLIKHQLQFETDLFKPESMVREGADRTVEDAAFLYLRDKKFTEGNAAKFLAAVKRPLEQCGHIKLVEFTSASWTELVQWLKSTKKPDGCFLSDATLHTSLSRVRTVIRWAHAHSMLDVLPYMPVPAPNYQRTVPPTPEEAQKIFVAAPPHLRRVVVLGTMLGLRVGESELLSLTWDKIDLLQGTVLIDTSHKNKNSPWREVPIQSSLIPLFSEWQAADLAAGIEHVVHYNGKPVKTIKHAWATALKLAGITRRIRPYDLRHAFASQLIANGCDVGTVARLLGHSSPQMVYQHYQHVSTVQKQSAVEQLPSHPVWQRNRHSRKLSVSA